MQLFILGAVTALSAALIVPQFTFAASEQVALGSCADNTCNDNLDCEKPDKLFSNAKLKASGPICILQNDYEGVCHTMFKGSLITNKCSSGTACQIVSSIKNAAAYDMMCIPITKTIKANDAINACKTSADCAADEQCLNVVVELDNVSIIDYPPFGHKLKNATRCIEISAIPPKALDGDGSCRTNKTCKDTESCVYDGADPSHLQWVCMDNTHISDSASCPKEVPSTIPAIKTGISCGKPDEKKLCSLKIDWNGYGGLNKKYVCTDYKFTPGAGAAPGLFACKSNTDCATFYKDGSYPYCIYNVKTQKNQCFPESALYTDVASAVSGKPVCKAPGAGGTCACDKTDTVGCASKPNTDTSVCATYFNTPDSKILVCIDNKTAGTGGASQSIPQQAESSERIAPKLEIDIPNLTFTSKILGTDTAQGHMYNIPYLSEYINAVYKWMMGFGILLAVFVMMYGGIRWMTSMGNMSAVSDAKKFLSNAVLGLILLASAYTILTVINPELISLNSLKIFAPKRAQLDVSPGEGNVDQSGGVGGSLNGKQGTTPVLSADCESNKLLPFNPLATKYKGTTKNPDMNFFTCGYIHKRNIKNISLIVIHEGGPSANSTADIWVSHSKDYTVGSHYTITQKGEIVQFAPEDLIANHTPGGGNGAANNNSIGIDLDIPTKGCNQTNPAFCVASTPEYKSCTYTPAQYATLNKLIQDIISRTKVTLDDDHIIQHCEVCGAGHCDIRNFDWTKIGLTQLKHRTADGVCIKRWHISGSCPVKKD